jgi:hypothetical protein
MQEKKEKHGLSDPKILLRRHFLDNYGTWYQELGTKMNKASLEDVFSLEVLGFKLQPRMF